EGGADLGGEAGEGAGAIEGAADERVGGAALEFRDVGADGVGAGAADGGDDFPDGGGDGGEVVSTSLGEPLEGGVECRRSFGEDGEDRSHERDGAWAVPYANPWGNRVLRGLWGGLRGVGGFQRAWLGSAG